MPDAASDPWSLGVLVTACLLAGLVRGFAGFGAAMIYLPLAATVLPPLEAIAVLIIMDVFGPMPVLRRAYGQAIKSELVILVSACALALPFGLMLLVMLPTDVVRTAVSFVALSLVLALVMGLRFQGALTRPLIAATGASGGFLGGLVGLPGPPIILLYMSRPVLIENIRANSMLYLFAFDIMMLGAFTIMGRFSIGLALLGLGLAVPSMIGSIIGTRMFNPAKEKAYRNIAYAIIATSAIIGLPIWGRL
jgi:uncharacterized membrane protein YfcA